LYQGTTSQAAEKLVQAQGKDALYHGPTSQAAEKLVQPQVKEALNQGPTSQAAEKLVQAQAKDALYQGPTSQAAEKSGRNGLCNKGTSLLVPQTASFQHWALAPAAFRRAAHSKFF
jgi:hypothetical protein